jgi:hypothetical protein
MTDDELRRTLAWLTDQMQEAKGDTPVWLAGAVCITCGHGLSAHVVVEHDADNPLPWPCKWPMVHGAPVSLCTCGDYTVEREEAVET